MSLTVVCRPGVGDHRGRHKVIWVLRNPLAVVTSMLNNWNPLAVIDLFQDVGVTALTGTDRCRHRLLGIHGLGRLRLACWAYRAKTAHLFGLRTRLGPSSLMVVDYDELALQPGRLLPAVFDFVNLEYRRAYSGRIHAHSLRKSDQLAPRDARTITTLCEHVYHRARALRFPPSPAR